MARKPLEELSPAYRARLEARAAAYRRKYNLPETFEVPRNIARGHKPQEHITRRERAIARGETPISSADYSFLRKQQARSPDSRNRIVGTRADGAPIFANESATQRFDRTRRAYLKLNREERDAVRHKQQRMERRYKAAVRRQESGDYGDEEFYEDEPDFEDDLTPIYFYH